MAPSTPLRRRKKGSDAGSQAKAAPKPLRRASRTPGRKAVSGSGSVSGSISGPDAAWRVYILRCADGTLYTGCTIDMARRLVCHGRRQVKYTRGRLPVELLYEESADDKSAALRREVAIKRLPRSQKLALADGQKL